jgi:CRISPR-associated endonuclease Csn1
MRILGIDVGIASIGWAVLCPPSDAGKLVRIGTWMFDPPEEGGGPERRLKNADRRMYRGQRRVLRRRAQRMAAIRQLFSNHSLLASSGPDALAGDGLDPWLLRAEGLRRKLAPREWAVTLGHIARHRAFRSNSKRDRGKNASPKAKGMLADIDRNRDKIARYETIGAAFALDPDFKDRKRNRGDFTRSMQRSDLEDEVRILFRRQASFGNTTTSDDFRDAFAKIAFSQLPIASSAGKVGECPFEPGEKRTAKATPAFERFRFLSRLAALRLQTGRQEARLTADQLRTAADTFGKTATFSFKALRELLDLAPSTRFAGVSAEKEKDDLVRRSGKAAEVTALLRKLLEPAIGKLDTARILTQTAPLDRAMEIVVFNEDVEEIAVGLASLGLPEAAVTALVQAVRDGDFARFNGAAHISAKAARAIIPGLMEGLDYAEACAAIGYDHAARPIVTPDKITNPVARKALHEALKQVKVLNGRFGPFDRIHVEMARDIAKGLEERLEIERGINERTATRTRHADELRKLLKVAEVRSDDILRHELWKEQGGFCLYTGQCIPPEMILSTRNEVQVDHILPLSRFHDNSFRNKTLCFTGANAEKRNRTPFEWFSEEKTDDDWAKYADRVERCKEMKGGKKKHHYLIREVAEREARMVERNLNDTRYACKVLLAELKRRYFPDAPHLVAARPGALVAEYRRAWGLNLFKKDKDNKRIGDDRHHAIDAVTVACIDDSMINQATRASQQAEREGRSFELKNLPPPWAGFRDDVIAARDAMVVARAPIGRARGKAHDATIKQIRREDGREVVYERRSIHDLELTDLERIPTPEPHGKVVDPASLRNILVERLRVWIEADKPKDEASLPRSPAGDIIRKVRLRTKDKVGVRVRNGTADRGDMVRVDIFTKPNRKGQDEWYAVPVYPHQVAADPEPPNRAVQAATPEESWPVMDSGFCFRFSLTHLSLVEVTKPDGEVIRGYFRGLDRATSAITVSTENDNSTLRDGIGLRKLMKLNKLAIDRLGNISEVPAEVRTWHGKACT